MVEIGQIKEVNIIDINHMGQGVTRIDDFVVFINNAIEGDLVEIEIIEVKKNFAVGKLLKIIKKSENRINAPCQYFSQCGGCQLMYIDYKAQLEYKKNRVLNELRRAFVNTESIIVNDTIGMEEPFRYRNKTAFSVIKKNNKIIVGPYEQGTYNTVNINSCMLQTKEADEVVNILKNLLIKYKVEPYDKRTRRGTIRNIVLRSNKQNEIMLILVTSSEIFPNKDLIVKELTTQVKEIKTVVQNINSRNTNLIMGYKNIVLFGNGTINDTVGELTFTISPDTFFQINQIQTEKIYEKVIEYANLNKDDICFDIYSGIGTISLIVAKYVKKVYGVEIVEQSIINARENAKLNKIENAEFLIGKAEEVLLMLYKKGINADVIIVDPPRKGCEKEVIDTIISMASKKVVYVSCNPSTLSRDIKLLENGGYKLKEVQPVDQFPWSTHVETVSFLTRP